MKSYMQSSELDLDSEDLSKFIVEQTKKDGINYFVPDFGMDFDI